MRVVRLGVVGRARRRRLHERDRRERREQRERQRDVDDRGLAGRRAQQQQRGDAAGAEQLRRHHAIGVGRAAQDAQRVRARPSPARRPTRASRNSAMAPPRDERPREQALLLPQLLDDRLRRVEAVVDERAVARRRRRAPSPGIRLVIVANVLRAKPGGKSSGQLDESRARAAGADRTRGGRRRSPATTDSQRKCGTSVSSAPKCRLPVAGGNRRRLAHVAQPWRTRPIARSPGFALCMSTIQSTKKAPARAIHRAARVGRRWRRGRGRRVRVHGAAPATVAAAMRRARARPSRPGGRRGAPPRGSATSRRGRSRAAATARPSRRSRSSP